MMKKKVTTLVAASLAALTLLAGCGSNGTADKKDGAAKGDKTLIVGTEPTFPPAVQKKLPQTRQLFFTASVLRRTISCRF